MGLGAYIPSAVQHALDLRLLCYATVFFSFGLLDTYGLYSKVFFACH